MAGGLGTRISEETESRPKPMVLLDKNPILWHVMSIFAKQGFDDFVIATGYKGHVIEDWIRGLDVTWKIQSLDTGLETQTGGRIFNCLESFRPQTWFVTYGDGLGNVNLHKLIKHHKDQRKFATVTAVRPPARFGSLTINSNLVQHFGEKIQSDTGWINGGFFILEPEIISYFRRTNENFESETLPRISMAGELSAYKHYGFWRPMDTLREKNELSLEAKKEPPPWLDFS